MVESTLPSTSNSSVHVGRIHGPCPERVQAPACGAGDARDDRGHRAGHGDHAAGRRRRGHADGPGPLGGHGRPGPLCPAPGSGGRARNRRPVHRIRPALPPRARAAASGDRDQRLAHLRAHPDRSPRHPDRGNPPRSPRYRWPGCFPGPGNFRGRLTKSSAARGARRLRGALRRRGVSRSGVAERSERARRRLGPDRLFARRDSGIQSLPRRRHIERLEP